MEDWCRQKDLLIERVFALTDQLEQEVLRGEWDVVDATLAARARVFLKIVRLDKEHGQQSTDRDALWLRQMEHIKRRGDAIYSKIRAELLRISQEFKAGEEERREILKDDLNNGKGSGIEKVV
jgi:hypothetical protein